MTEKKKALFLCSSPAKESKTNKVVEIVSKLLVERNIDSEVINIAGLKYKTNGCIACMSCQQSEKYECAVKDDAIPILEKIPQVDYLIFATPVYFFGPNAQLKLVLDRTFSLFKLNEKEGSYQSCLKSGLKIALISTAGGDLNAGLTITEDTFRALATFTGIKFNSLLVPVVDSFEPVEKSEEIKKMSADFVEKLTG